MRKFKNWLFPVLTLLALFWMGAVYMKRNLPSADPVSTEYRSRISAEEAAPVNLNTAKAEELEKLPGIGPTRAEEIIADRTQNGPFQTVEDIMRVSGIGRRTYEQIRDLVYVEDSYENRYH